MLAPTFWWCQFQSLIHAPLHRKQSRAAAMATSPDPVRALSCLGNLINFHNEVVFVNHFADCGWVDIPMAVWIHCLQFPSFFESMLQNLLLVLRKKNIIKNALA